jgi:heme-binding protein
MKMTATTMRRGLYGVFAGGLMGAAASATIALPTANAAPPDTSTSCTASGVATTVNSVSTSISQYLEAHPDTNQALLDISKQPTTQANASYRTYFAGNPQVATELRNLQRPLTDLNSQCGIQIEPSQVVTGFSAALNQQGTPGTVTPGGVTPGAPSGLAQQQPAAVEPEM